MEQLSTAKIRSPHSPTLRVGDYVQFDCGEHAGVCGELTWLSLTFGWIAVMTQNGDLLNGHVEQVSKV